jgi:hypothetical protein
VFLLRSFVERVEELVALGYGYLQSLFGFLARLAFPDEPSATPVRHNAPILSVMSHPFGGCRAKIGRAYEHLETFETEFAASAQQGIPITFGSEFDSQTQTVSTKIIGLPEIPDRWMLIAADALQNFRAALNYLAWELAILELRRQGEAREPKSNTEFPIATEPERFRADRITDLHPLHQTMIRGFQPYHGRYRAPAHPLALLQRLTNTDKHRTFQFGFVTAIETLLGRYTAHDCTVTHSNYFILDPFQIGAEYARHDVIPTGPNPTIHEQPSLALAIAFGDGWAVVPTLMDIGAKVNEIVGAFRLFFPPSPGQSGTP